MREGGDGSRGRCCNALVAAMLLLGSVHGGRASAAGGPALHGVEMFVPTGSMHVHRVQSATVRLRDGRVLVVGGADDTTQVSSAEIYDPATETFRLVGSMSHARVLPTATLLPDGRVLVAGGWDGSQDLDSTEIF